MAETRLRQALDILRAGGMIKRSYTDPTGTQHCAAGALRRAWDGKTVIDTAEEGHTMATVMVPMDSRRGYAADLSALQIACEAQTGTGMLPFNDRTSTTLADVEPIFEKAALHREELI